MFTYQDARGIQDSYSEKIIFYMCLVLIFFSAKNHKRVKMIIEKKVWQIKHQQISEIIKYLKM